MTEPYIAKPDTALQQSARQHKSIEARLTEQIEKLEEQRSQLNSMRRQHEGTADHEFRTAFQEWALAEWKNKTGCNEETVVLHEGKTVALKYLSYYASSRSNGAWEVTVSNNYASNSRLAFWYVDSDNVVQDSNVTQPINITDLPAGLSYPSRKSITASLRGASTKINDESGFDIGWNYVQQYWNQQGKVSADSLVGSMTYTLDDVSELRKIAWHRNRCQQLSEIFEKKGILSSYSYEPVTRSVRHEWDAENNTWKYEDRLAEYRAVFSFKMTPQKEV